MRKFMIYVGHFLLFEEFKRQKLSYWDLWQATSFMTTKQAGMVAVRNGTESYIDIQRLHITCTVFQAELHGNDMAVNWIGKQRTKAPSYAINVDSTAALLAIANKQVTHPLAVAIRRKTIDLRKVTSVSFHWIRGHTGQEGNEWADYLARTIAS